MDQDKKYWNSFYNAVDRRLLIPSQFATFVANECVDVADTIIDLGCGNGRDALFFSALGFKVIGVDASDKAIEFCRERSQNRSTFLCHDILDKDLLPALMKSCGDVNKLLIYSRFFLHAISETDELIFWSLVEKLCNRESLLAVEFRTNRDENLNKATGQHYRRFIKPFDLLQRANKAGFVCEYFAEGFGFAKYKTDDAHVVRIIFNKID